MRIAALVAGNLRGRALGRLLEGRVAGLSAAGHAIEVTVPTDDDVAWLAGRGLEAQVRSCRDVLLELLPGAARPVTSADAVLVMYGAYDPLLECLRLFRGRPVVFEYAGVRPPGRGASLEACEARAQDAAHRALARSATRVLVSTPALARELADAVALHDDEVSVVPLESRQGPAATPSARAPILRAVGRIAPHKRLDVMIEALARVRRVHPDARLVIAGRNEDPEADAARRDAVAWARALGVAWAVEFAGFLADEALYAGVNVVLVTGDCLVEAEARAHGCPVVKSSDGAEMAAGVLAALAAPAPALSPPVASPDWSALLAAPARRPVSLVPLLEHLESSAIAYTDTSAQVSPARWKVMRHLHKFFALKLERLALEQIQGTARVLRALDRDLAQLESRLPRR